MGLNLNKCLSSNNLETLAGLFSPLHPFFFFFFFVQHVFLSLVLTTYRHSCYSSRFAKSNYVSCGGICIAYSSVLELFGFSGVPQITAA